MDAVTKKARRTPMFIAGAVMLLVGLVPIVAVLLPGWNGISDVSPLTAFAPVGAVLMGVARAKASEEWRKSR